jgi:thiazole/oxazole-forming peptide maturase SagD family component
MKEPVITHLISTGGACGETRETTLLGGLYELIERDAFTTTYLIKAPVTKLLVDSIHDEQVRTIAQSLKRYRLEWHLFEITNDIEVPVFLSLIIDRTGIGPALTGGASAGWNTVAAIIKSVSEATMSRPWLRAALSRKEGYQSIIKREVNGIRDRLERAFYWYPVSQLRHVSFLLDMKGTAYTDRLFTGIIQDEIDLTLKKLADKNYPVFYTDITHEPLRKQGFLVYKVMSPALHGLYLDEEKSFKDMARLRKVAHHFGMKKFEINPIPHPFL